MVASGNDFVLIEHRTQNTEHRELSRVAKKICNRKYGVGADGLLILGKSCVADIRMRIFNADGSEAQMCGNGARCVALYARRRTHGARLNIETKAGIIIANVFGDNVKIRLTDPKEIKLDIPLKIGNRTIRVNFINSGVPHTVIFTEGLDKIDVFNLGRLIRFHRKFSPAGTNVNFVEVLGKDALRVRTYERGVEDETLACGTGSAAAALVYALKCPSGRKIKIQTQGGEALKVYFQKEGRKFRDVWLEGRASVVFVGKFMY
jgi:diaminopimelate epimerase